MAAPSSAGSLDPPAAPASSAISPIPAVPPGAVSSSAPPPLLPLPSHFPPHSILGRAPNPSPGHPAGILYTVGAAGRGYPPRPVAVGRGFSGPHIVTVANPAGYIRNNSPTAVVTFSAGAVQARPGGFPSDHGVQMYQPLPRLQRQQQGTVHQGRPPFQQPLGQLSAPPLARSRTTGGGGVGAPPTPDFAPSAVPTPGSKVSSFPIEASQLEPRDKHREDGTIQVYDRKVRLSESPTGSLYGLCRSWVHNGLHQEIQPKFGAGVQLLPKPLPQKAVESTSLGKILLYEDTDDQQSEENGESIDQLSARDLLQSYVKRARRVRASLREDRLRRIERYKQRLALLLPLPTESERSPGS